MITRPVQHRNLLSEMKRRKNCLAACSASVQDQRSAKLRRNKLSGRPRWSRKIASLHRDCIPLLLCLLRTALHGPGKKFHSGLRPVNLAMGHTTAVVITVRLRARIHTITTRDRGIVRHGLSDLIPCGVTALLCLEILEMHRLGMTKFFLRRDMPYLRTSRYSIASRQSAHFE
jgi:hypothetical protein